MGQPLQLPGAGAPPMAQPVAMAQPMAMTVQQAEPIRGGYFENGQLLDGPAGCGMQWHEAAVMQGGLDELQPQRRALSRQSSAKPRKPKKPKTLPALAEPAQEPTPALVPPMCHSPCPEDVAPVGVANLQEISSDDDEV